MMICTQDMLSCVTLAHKPVDEGVSAFPGRKNSAASSATKENNIWKILTQGERQLIKK